MQIEYEKDYEFSQEDFELIKSKYKFVNSKINHDIYLDDDEFSLIKKNIRLRKRNWILELKYPQNGSIFEKNIFLEYESNEAKKRIEELWFDFYSFKEKFWYKNLRNSFTWNILWFDVNFDFDDFWFWKMYEMEIVFGEWAQENIEVDSLFKIIRKKLNLQSKESLNWKLYYVIKDFDMKLFNKLKELWIFN